jgi:hypothetical protein
MLWCICRLLMWRKAPAPGDEPPWAEFPGPVPTLDRILRGAKPADIPVEQPIKLDLAVNLNTAKALDLVIPETFLLRADEVVRVGSPFAALQESACGTKRN